MARPIVRPLARQVVKQRYQGGQGASLPILMYHRVMAELDPMQPEVPTAAMLNTQFKALAEMFRVLPLNEGVQRLLEGTLPARSVCVTFDDGYADNHSIALPLLREHGLTATVFVATGFLDGGRMFNDTVVESVRRLPTGEADFAWLGLGRYRVSDVATRHHLAMQLASRIKYLEHTQREEACTRLMAMADGGLPTDLMMTSEQVLDLSRKGVSIGGHTVSHPILAKVSPETARWEIRENREVLSRLLDAPPTCFAYPNGKPGLDYSTLHADLVREIGYAAAVSTAVGVATLESPRFQIPRFVSRERHEMSFVARVLRMAAHTRAATAI